MKSYYEDIEDQLCALLCPKDQNGVNLNLNYTVDPLPDNELEYKRSFPISRTYISCVGSDFGEDENNEIVIQEETIIFEAMIRSKSRRGDSGIFAVLSDIRKKLLGYKFPGCKKIIMIKSGYIDGGTQNDWNYMLSFSFRRKVVENYIEPDAPLATNIEFTDGTIN